MGLRRDDYGRRGGTIHRMKGSEFWRELFFPGRNRDGFREHTPHFRDETRNTSSRTCPRLFVSVIPMIAEEKPQSCRRARREERKKNNEKRSCDCDFNLRRMQMQPKSKSTSTPSSHHRHRHSPSHHHQRFLRPRTIDTIHHRQVSYHFWIVALPLPLHWHWHYYYFSISVLVLVLAEAESRRVVATLLSGMLLVDINMNMNHEHDIGRFIAWWWCFFYFINIPWLKV